jgi:hypothetical protein
MTSESHFQEVHDIGTKGSRTAAQKLHFTPENTLNLLENKAVPKPMCVITGGVELLNLYSHGFSEQIAFQTRNISSSHSSLVDTVENSRNSREELRFESLCVFKQAEGVASEIADTAANTHTACLVQPFIDVSKREVGHACTTFFEGRGEQVGRDRDRERAVGKNSAYATSAVIWDLTVGELRTFRDARSTGGVTYA